MMAPETVVTVEHNKPTTPPQQQQGGALDWIKINTDYFKTPPGILKVIELVLGILCMALASSWYSTWFVFVAVSCFITTLMWSFVYFLSIREALRIPINWVLSVRSNMSHTVTITRTTAVSSGTPLFINSGYLGTMPGLLKLAQLLMGAACVGIIGHYYNTSYRNVTAELFFLLVATSFLIGTFCLITSCVLSLSTATLISKTVYEVVYHGLGFILYLAAGITFLTMVNQNKNTYYYSYEPYMAAAIMGLILAGLYLLSTVMANRSYRGI
ncbi:LOW QUALITY PROTEIN: uncharacterized protein ACR2FA_002501 [Aphomia sociella]